MLAFVRAIPSAAPRGARCLSIAVEDASVKTVANGVKVGSVALQGETATVTAYVNAGSRYESVNQNGVAHLFQQSAMAAKTNEINELGGVVTGRATNEHIVFEARVLKEHVPKATALLGEMLKPVSDVAAGKNAVEKVLQDADAHPEHIIMDHLHDAAFLNTAMGMPTVGTHETVGKLGAQDLADFAASHMTGGNVSVAAAGDFDKAAFEAAAEAAFGSLPAGSSTATGTVFTGSDKRIRYDSMNTAHVAFAFEGAAFGSPEMYPLMVMQAYLGSHNKNTDALAGHNRTSRLITDISEQRAAPVFQVFNKFYKDTGLFGISFQAPDNTLDDTMWYSLHNLVRMCHKTDDADVAFAQTMLKTQLASTLSSSSGVAADVAESLSLAGRHIGIAEKLSAIDSVTAAHVRETGMNVVHDQEHALAAVGPIYELPDINWIRRRSYWLRY